jgi:hypothetical protein
MVCSFLITLNAFPKKGVSNPRFNRLSQRNIGSG